MPFPTRRLPAQPNLDHLRKQAKDLLHDYRAGDQAAVSEVRRFEHLPPQPEQFELHDAQRILARAYGYESWAKLKSFVDGANIRRLAEAVEAGDVKQARALLRARPEMAAMDMAENDERRAIHFAVLRRDAAMVRLLMQAGAEARKGVWPHRDATTAYALARERGFDEIVAAIEEEEQHRRAAASCPNVTVSPVQEQIHRAIREGDNAEAIRLLEADPSLIGACDRLGGTALHAAAGAENEEMLGWLLDRHANPRKQDLEGRTPLDRAALAADARFPAIARRLLFHGAEMTVRAAVAMGECERVRELATEDPGILRRDVQWDRGGLLTLAVRHGQVEMVRLLLDLGADVDERTALREVEEPTESWGMPLWHAALGRQREIVELLLDRGADPNANVYASGWPLRNAYPDEALRRLLMERGAKAQPYMAAEMHDVEEVRRMLAAGATEEAVQELAWSAACHGCAAIVEMALPRIPWPAADTRWHWILIQPIRGIEDDSPHVEGFFASMAILLRRGIDVNAATRMGQTVLHFTAGRRGVNGALRARFAAMLVDAGARLDVRDDLLRSTPLGWACRWGCEEMAALLVARGAPVNEPDAELWATPLAWAGKMGHTGIADLLRRHGATG